MNQASPLGLCGGIGRVGAGVTRFFADPFVERYSPTAVARVLLGVLGAGVLLVFFAPSGWLALVGFAMMGIGTSVIFLLRCRGQTFVRQRFRKNLRQRSLAPTYDGADRSL